MDDFDSLPNSYRVGDIVYVKPVGVKCTTEWPEGEVTNIISETAVEVNGVNRHVADLRLARRQDTGSCSDPRLPSDSTDDGANYVDVELDFDNASDIVVDSDVDTGRPVRDRRPPERFGESYTF